MKNAMTKTITWLNDVDINFMRVIKRYNNRKLYDTETRTYITLDGVAKLVVSGEEVQVVDNDTDEDITTVIFSQLLLEREREQRFLPSGMLSQLLRFGGETSRKLGTTLTRPFTLTFGQFLEQEVERTFKFWVDIAEGREEDMLRFIERLIEQRRRTHQASSPNEGNRKNPNKVNRLDIIEDLPPK